ncbi:hypothetical protein BKA70DRAFT_1334735 [Coprinopsis sp. MPI-PUGE-AT-0042]|nr:hypothetical protein BKA70DRAFT_1334735 [Coprinopsis sp. MPI-PUGE-AT-0042]
MTTKAILPTEILLEIFRQSLPRRLDTKGRLGFQAIRSVCSRWRSISFSSPELWSSLSVTCEGKKPDGVQLPRLEQWLSRSGLSTPLELHFQYEDFTLEMMLPEDEISMRNLIRHYQPRWRYLSLCIEPRCFWDSILSPPSTDWINLQTLTLWVFDFNHLSSERYPRGLDQLTSITSLRRLFIEDDSPYTHQTHYGPVDLAELHITLDEVSRSDHVRLISSYAQLTKLTLVATLYHELDLAPDEHINLPFLSSFSYTTDDLSLLHHLTTPALVNLELSFLTSLPTAEEALTPFLARCTSALQTISLTEASFLAKALPTFSVRPSLTEISLDAWPLDATDNILAEPDHAVDAWLPNLRQLTVSMGPKRSTGSSEATKDLELEQMSDLAKFLLQREDRCQMGLERLIVHKRSRAIKFPYELFERIDLGELRVMVPW